MTDQVFETRINNRLPTISHVYESTGERICSIASKGWMTITSESPLSTYARYDQVDIYPDHVELHQRAGWQEPSRGAFEIEVINRDGGELEGWQGVSLPKGVPVRIGIELTSPMIWWMRIEIKRVWERRKSPVCEGYYQRVPTVKEVYVPRPLTERMWITGLAKTQGVDMPEFKTPEDEKPSEYEITFENQRKESVVLWSDNGLAFCTIGPGQSVLLESYSPATYYSRYKRITYKKNGEIDLDINKDWRPPWELSQVLLNRDGPQIEGVKRAGKDINLYKGIPRVCEVHDDEVDHQFESMTLVEKEEKVKHGDYIVGTRKVLVWEKKLRAKKELEAIREKRAALIDKQAADKKKRLDK
jgi:hypothetical protein